jgi:hypothetical protein
MELQSAWSLDSTKSLGVVYQNDGINLERSYLKRKDTVAEIIRLTRERKHVVLGSPPATGKTALLQFVKKELRNDERIKVVHRCLTTLVKVERVVAQLEKLGIKNDDDSCTDESANAADTYRETWILLDDAQNWYAEEYWSFWQRIVKQLPAFAARRSM